MLASATRAATGTNPGLTLEVAIGLLLVGGMAAGPLRRRRDTEVMGTNLGSTFTS